MKAVGSQHICSKCELKLPANLPEILCPRCALREVERAEGRTKLPRRFGNYELLEEIGRGGMGVVYKARQIALDRVVAIKVVLHGEHAAPEVVRRFRVEARAAGKFRHRNLIAVHEVGTHDGDDFMVMDFVDGVPLSSVIKSGPLLPRRAAVYAASIARGIAHAHKQGVLHRDLKPSNVLIDLEDEVRVSDFGLAKSLDENSELTVPGQVLGTPIYMPPEQACGNREAVGPRSDVYSVGSLLYHLLAGEPPFAGKTVFETLQSVLHDPPPPLRAKNSAVPHDLETICEKCMAKEPEQRYASASELADDLDRFLRFEPVRARRSSCVERAVRWSRRNRAAASLILVLAVGSLTLSGALYRTIQAEKAKMQAIKIISDRLGRNIEQLWKQNVELVEPVTSEELSALAGKYKKLSPDAMRLRLAVKPPDSSLDLQQLYQPFIEHLEENVGKRLRTDTRIDLAVSMESSESRVVATGPITFTRMGAAKYLSAVDSGAPIVGLVQEIAEKEAQIFVHRDSGIRKLSDLRGRSIIFAEKKSTISEWAKYHLVRDAGITGKDLRWEKIDPPHGAPLKTHSHKPGIDRVLAKELDASVGRSKYVKQHPELRPIYTFWSTPNVWVISSSAPPRLREALREALLGIRNPALLQSAPTEIKGFAPIDEQMLRKLESALDDEVQRFEQR